MQRRCVSERGLLLPRSCLSVADQTLNSEGLA